MTSVDGDFWAITRYIIPVSSVCPLIANETRIGSTGAFREHTPAAMSVLMLFSGAPGLHIWLENIFYDQTAAAKGIEVSRKYITVRVTSMWIRPIG